MRTISSSLSQPLPIIATLCRNVRSLSACGKNSADVHATVARAATFSRKTQLLPAHSLTNLVT